MLNASKNHLKEANENYFLHILVALKIAINLIIAGIKALIHAFVPGLFTRSASNKISELYLFMQKRGENNFYSKFDIPTHSTFFSFK